MYPYNWQALTRVVWPDNTMRELALNTLSRGLAGNLGTTICFLVGPPGTGKTTIINSIAQLLLGDYALFADPRTNHHNVPTDIRMLIIDGWDYAASKQTLEDLAQNRTLVVISNDAPPIDITPTPIVIECTGDPIAIGAACESMCRTWELESSGILAVLMDRVQDQITATQH